MRKKLLLSMVLMALVHTSILAGMIANSAFRSRVVAGGCLAILSVLVVLWIIVLRTKD